MFNCFVGKQGDLLSLLRIWVIISANCYRFRPQHTRFDPPARRAWQVSVEPHRVILLQIPLDSRTLPGNLGSTSSLHFKYARRRISASLGNWSRFIEVCALAGDVMCWQSLDAGIYDLDVVARFRQSFTLHRPRMSSQILVLVLSLLTSQHDSRRDIAW